MGLARVQAVRVSTYGVACAPKAETTSKRRDQWSCLLTLAQALATRPVQAMLAAAGGRCGVMDVGGR